MPVVGCVKLPTVVVHPTWRSPWQPVKETRSLHCLISHLKLNTSRYLSIEHLAFSHRRCGWCLGAAPPGRYNSALSLSLSLSGFSVELFRINSNRAQNWPRPARWEGIHQGSVFAVTLFTALSTVNLSGASRR